MDLRDLSRDMVRLSQRQEGYCTKSEDGEALKAVEGRRADRFRATYRRMFEAGQISREQYNAYRAIIQEDHDRRVNEIKRLFD